MGLQKKWLTPVEVSELYGVATQTLACWRAQGVGPEYVKIPHSRLIRYEASKLEAWFRRGEVKTVNG